MVQIDTEQILSIEETTVTVRAYRHRTTIPAKVFKFLDLEQGDMLRWVALKDGTIFITKVPETV